MTKLFYKINDGNESELAMIPTNADDFHLITIRPKEFATKEGTHMVMKFEDDNGNKFEIGYRKEDVIIPA